MACVLVICFFYFRKLSLSTNMIEKISGISLLKNLKVLSLGRNYIKTFSGLEAIGETLEELWLSYNLIEKIKGVGVLKKLKVLYLSNNIVKDWPEFNKLQEIPNLEDLVFVGLYASLGSHRTEISPEIVIPLFVPPAYP
uniref:Dynein axonemal light chain 1 n=1 Tax=Timema douglasi TaxID=61478 RepID=A0A7R8ZDL3_TIMDO|nr:unnamed protein product [Timema douglasi]